MTAGEAATAFEIAREPELSPATMEFITGAANHEAKLLLELYFAQTAGLLGELKLTQSFREFLGPEAEWCPSDESLARYCDDSMGAVAQVVRRKINTHTKIALSGFELCEDRLDLGVPMAAGLLRWSLDYPDVSLQRLLGGTRSNSQVRTPQFRTQTLFALVRAARPLSISEIAGVEHLPNDSQEYKNKIISIDNSVRRLEIEGLLTVKRQITDNQTQFDIVPLSRQINPRSLLVAGIYAYRTLCESRSQSSFKMLECLDFIEAWMASRGEPTDKAELRQQLNDTLCRTGSERHQRWLPGLKRNEKFSETGLTSVALVEDFRQALTDFVGILQAIDGQADETIRNGYALAEEIAGNDAYKGMLINKAHRFSHDANSQPHAETCAQILALVAEEGTLSVAALHRLYVHRYRKVGASLIRNATRLMADDQLLRVDTQPVSDSRRHPAHFFSLTPAAYDRYPALASMKRPKSTP